MKRLISIISLTVVAVAVTPSQAQTVTYANRSSVFNRAAANRTASMQRSRHRSRIHTQQRSPRALKTRQLRAHQRMRSTSRAGVRASASAQTVGKVRRQINAARARVPNAQLNRRVSPGRVQTRVIKRRLATDAEVRMYRPRRVVR